MLNTKQVAEKLKCTPRNIRLLVSKGELNPIYRGKRFFLFTEIEVNNFLKIKSDVKNHKLKVKPITVQTFMLEALVNQFNKINQEKYVESFWITFISLYRILHFLKDIFMLLIGE